MSNKSGTPISSLTEPMEYVRNHLSESQRKELFDALREPELPTGARDAVGTLDEIIAHDVDLIEPVICRWLTEDAPSTTTGWRWMRLRGYLRQWLTPHQFEIAMDCLDKATCGVEERR